MNTFPTMPFARFSQVMRYANERRKHSSYKMLGVQLLVSGAVPRLAVLGKDHHIIEGK